VLFGDLIRYIAARATTQRKVLSRWPVPTDPIFAQIERHFIHNITGTKPKAA